MRRRFLTAALPLILAPSLALAQGDLGALSDEFGAPASIAQWSRVQTVEQWNIEPLEIWDVGVTAPGRMTMQPYTVTWYADRVGPLAFQAVTGDFAITTQVRATGRDGVSRPAADFSLAGIMIRAPRDVTPATWTPGGEDYVFLSLGWGHTVPSWQYEVKTTIDGVSTLFLSPAPGPEAQIQTARLGGTVITLRREPGQPWVVHRRYPRPDLPPTLQAGLVAYTDWNKVQYVPTFTHNSTVLVPGMTGDPRPDVPFAPDLLATFDYARYFRLTLPPELQGLDLSDPGQVSDAQLLAFLGDHAHAPGTVGVEDLAPTGRGLSAHPSPTRGATTIAFTLERPGPVRIRVHDLAGRVVRELTWRGLTSGEHRVAWDGCDDAGRPAANGFYLIRLERPDSRPLVHRLVLLR